jgi:methylated-DNA-[protein]-cysteine S-methyltransferase
MRQERSVNCKVVERICTVRKSNKPFFYMVVPSRLGEVGIVWFQKERNPSVVRILQPHKDHSLSEVIHGQFPGAAERSDQALKKLSEHIKVYMQGLVVEFSLDCLDMEQCYEFQRRVLRTLYQVPRGKVISYGQLAERASAPRAARAVGTALAKNPFPIILPCHRVVKSTGHLGHFGGGVELKKAYLEIEGIRINEKEKILPDYFW